MEELELKEDYSGMSREEQLELANLYLENVKHSVKNDRLIRNSYNQKHCDLNKYKYLIRSMEIASEIFHAHQKTEQYINALIWKAYLYIEIDPAKSILLIEEQFTFVFRTLGKKHDYVVDMYYILGWANAHMRKFNFAWNNYQKALAIQEKASRKTNKITGFCYSGIGECYLNKGDFIKAINFYKKALKVYKQFSVHPKEISAKYYSLASAYLMSSRYKKAIFYVQKALDLMVSNYGEKSYLVPAAYNLMGIIYGQQGDIERQLFYQQKSLSVNKYHKNDEGIGHSYNSLCSVFFKIGDFEEALIYCLKAKEVREKSNQIEEENRRLVLAETYNNLGAIYIKLQKFGEANHFVKKSMQIRKELLGDRHLLLAWGYLNLGKIHIQKKEQKEGIAYLKQALSIRLQYFSEKHKGVADIYIRIANAYIESKKIVEGIENCQAALSALFYNCKTTGMYYTPKAENYILSTSILEALRLKGSTLLDYFKFTNDLKNLQCALESFKCADKIIGQIQRSYRTEGSKLLLSRNIIPVYEEGMRVIFEAYQMSLLKKLDLSFDFCEKMKAILLLSTIQDKHAKITLNLPLELLEQEEGLKVNLTFLDKTIQKLTLKQKEEKLDKYEQESLQDAQNQFFDFHQKHTQLLQRLETDYPDYYQLKYDTKTVTPTELQSTLTDNQILLSYFIGEKSLYIFTVSSNEFEVEELEKPDDFEEMIQGFLKSIHAHDKADYLQLAYELYELLIAPVELHWFDDWGDLLEEEETAPKQLIVIPHAELSYLPFEALISEPADEEKAYPELKYLVKNYEISYHYSATLWQYAQQKKGERAETEHSFVGFAPVYESTLVTNECEGESGKYEVGSDALVENLNEAAKVVGQWATRSEALRSDGTWTPLPHSKEEAENIAALFEGKGLSSQTYLYENATKEAFQKAVEKSRYLLVAAHGVVNDEKTALSGLVFYPNKVVKNSPSFEKHGDIWNGGEEMSPSLRDVGESSKNDCILSMEETYPLNIHADLVVLSSCESGIGKLHKGEGMMAVNRGFLVAGAKNVISTLFKVYDKPSSLLTQYLFEAILEQEDYRTALRKAKLRLLEAQGVSPKSWCGFVLIGA